MDLVEVQLVFSESFADTTHGLKTTKRVISVSRLLPVLFILFSILAITDL